MAIRSTDLLFRTEAGVVIPNGKLHNLFGAGETNSGTQYKGLEVVNNNATLTLSSVRAWLTLDDRGGTFALAYDGGAAQAMGENWDTYDAATLTFSSPVTQATGIVLPNLAPQTKVRLVARRTLSGASVATPENNRIWVGGSSPL